MRRVFWQPRRSPRRAARARLPRRRRSMSPATLTACSRATCRTPVCAAFWGRSGLDGEGAGPQGAWTLDGLTAAAVWFDADIAVARARWRQAVAAETTAAQRAQPVLARELAWDTQPDGDEEFAADGRFLGRPAARRGGSADGAPGACARRDRRLGLSRPCAAAGNAAPPCAAPPSIAMPQSSASPTPAPGAMSSNASSRFMNAAGRSAKRGSARCRGRAATPATQRAKRPASRGTERPAAGVWRRRWACRWRRSRRCASICAASKPPWRAPRRRRTRVAQRSRAASTSAPRSPGTRRRRRGWRWKVARLHPEITLEPGLFWDQGGLVWSLGSQIGLGFLFANRGRWPKRRRRARRRRARCWRSRRTFSRNSLRRMPNSRPRGCGATRRGAALRRAEELRGVAEARRAGGEAGRLAGA